jgi:ABC-type Zn2+ transport system substrate-binding protein/surface adhesin
VFCAEIEHKVSEIDPANADAYKSNYDEYIKKLNDLDSKFETLFAVAPEKTLVFGDRFPFRYFVDDYGLDYYAAFTLRRLCVKVFFSIVQIQRKIANLSIFWNYFPSLIAACTVDRKQ